MNKIIKKIPSPLFIGKYSELIIWEPKSINQNTPVIFIYDGQILQTEEKEFFEKKGIRIFKHVRDIIGDAIIISVNSMRKDDKCKYKKRTQELKNYKNHDYVFMRTIRQEIYKLKHVYTGKWVGIGFSLSGWLIGKENMFDTNIMISPVIENDVYYLNANSIVFFGTKEYCFHSNKIINNPLYKLQQKNKNISFHEIKNLKHTFKSWDANMPFILKQANINV